MDERDGPNINIITKGGTKTGVDAESPHEIKICKVVPEDTKYEPTRKKELFKCEIEMFRDISSPSRPLVVETSYKKNSYQPRVARESPT
jgi:hypothetical protein